MAKFMDKFTDILSTVAEAVDGNKYLSVLKSTFSIYLPFIMIGSFATLFKTILCSPTAGLAKWIPQMAVLDPAFAAINFATMSTMTLIIVFIMGMLLGKKNKVPEYISGILALCSYITVVPNSITQFVDKAKAIIAVAPPVPCLPLGAINAQGLFVGMILTVFVVELFTKLCTVKQLKITMPASVPTQIATSFNTLIPILIVLVVFSSLGCIFTNMTGSFINEWIYKIVQAPLEVIFQSPAGIIAIVVLSQLFWFLGIHGGLVISPIRNPLMFAALAANIAAVQAGQLPTQPITMGFWLTFIVVGGAGITLSLVFAILAFSKREDYRMIAKMALAPGLCGISEPIVFGLPMVMNPIFALPFIFCSGIATAIALLAVKIGFILPGTVDVPFGVPTLLNAFIGFGWQGMIVQIIILAVCVACYTPFVLVSNKQYQKEQTEAAV
jgi:PTS system cellobiose-specific IIC component